MRLSTNSSLPHSSLLDTCPSLHARALPTEDGSVCLQSLLRAVGVGAAKSLPSAAGINWVLKDGLGRIGRLTVATRFGQSFDADLKVATCSLQTCRAVSPCMPVALRWQVGLHTGHQHALPVPA